MSKRLSGSSSSGRSRAGQASITITVHGAKGVIERGVYTRPTQCCTRRWRLPACGALVLCEDAPLTHGGPPVCVRRPFVCTSRADRAREIGGTEGIRNRARIWWHGHFSRCRLHFVRSTQEVLLCAYNPFTPALADFHSNLPAPPSRGVNVSWGSIEGEVVVRLCSRSLSSLSSSNANVVAEVWIASRFACVACQASLTPVG